MAEFTLWHACNFAEKGDVYNTAGCLNRIAAYLTQTLFALNERYFFGNKKVMEALSALPLIPEDYANNMQAILANPGATRQELSPSVIRMEALWQSVRGLAGNYLPKY